MLTQLDLENIGELIDEKLDTKLDQKFRQEFDPLKKDVTSMKQDVASLKQDVSILKKDMKRVKSKVNKIDKIEKDLAATIAFFDKDQYNLHKRVDRVEDHLNLPQLEL